MTRILKGPEAIARPRQGFERATLEGSALGAVRTGRASHRVWSRCSRLSAMPVSKDAQQERSVGEIPHPLVRLSVTAMKVAKG